MSRIEPGSMDYFNERNESVVVPNISKLVGAFRDRQIPIVFVWCRVGLQGLARHAEPSPRMDQTD